MISNGSHQTFFMRLKPCYVTKLKKANQCLCVECYNFDKITKASVDKISVKGSNIINSMQCTRQEWYEMDECECECDECYNCAKTVDALKSLHSDQYNNYVAKIIANIRILNVLIKVTWCT